MLCLSFFYGGLCKTTLESFYSRFRIDHSSPLVSHIHSFLLQDLLISYQPAPMLFSFELVAGSTRLILAIFTFRAKQK